METPLSSLDTLFRPRSVAIIGASTNPNKIGGRPIAFLKRGGYQGAIYPVNLQSPEIQGLRAYATISDLPTAVDQAIIALPAAQVLDALEACIAQGIPMVQILSAGFAEAGEAGKGLQEQLRVVAAKAGVRLLGPNTLGVFNVAQGFFGTFAIALDGAWPRPGNIGIASQSGAFGSYVFALAAMRGLGLSQFVTTGNESDIDVAECIAYLAHDPDTHVIIATLESCHNGARLINALREAHASRKPILLMKVGASEVGAAAAMTHTGSLAGADRVYDAVFHQFHAYRATTIDELLDLAYVCAQGVLPRDASAMILTTSGGIGILMADTAAECGVTLPALPEMTRQRVREIWRFASGDNPLDTTAQLIVDLPRFVSLLEVILAEAPFSAVVSFLAHLGRIPAHFNQLRDPLAALRRRYPDRLFVLSMLCDPALQTELEGDSFLVFPEPTRAIRALGGAARLAHGLEQKIPGPPAVTQERAMRPSGPLDELAANRVLAEAGVPMVRQSLATSADQAATIARAIGFPVALKIASPDIRHKTDVGGVLLGIESEQAARAGFEHLIANARRVSANVSGVLVAPMVHGGVECILGAQCDPVFGPVVMFGLGGVLVELVQDVVFRVAPFEEADAQAMIEETLGARLLRGFRGRPQGDLTSLSRALASLSRFAYANRDVVAGIDINPLIVLPDRVIGVDARIEIIGHSQPRGC